MKDEGIVVKKDFSQQ